MGRLTKGYFFDLLASFGNKGRNSSWCESKCVNDPEFSIPYQLGDPLFFQLDVAWYNPMFYVCEVHLCDLSRNRINPNLMATYGLSYWRENRDFNGLNRFTFKFPPAFGPCQTFAVRDPNCCMIDLKAQAEAMYLYYNSYIGLNATAAITSATLTIGGNTYDIKNNVLPAGWSFVNIYPKRYIQMPCNLARGFIDIDVVYTDDAGNIHNLHYDVETENCPAQFCSCNLLVPTGVYADINFAHSNGVAYDRRGSVIFGNSPTVPGISPASMHTTSASNIPFSGGHYIIPIDCDLRNEGLDLEQQPVPPATAPPPVSYVYEIETSYSDCISNTVNQKLDCFMFEVELGFDGACGALSVYSEPFDCYSCSNTLVIKSDYKGRQDCEGNFYKLANRQLGNSTINQGGLLTFENTLRIPAVLRKLPGKLTVTKNERSFSFKSERTEQFELQGTRLYPPYFADMVENVLGGADFYINGDLYQVTGEKIFDKVEAEGVTAFSLRAILTKKSCEVVFDC